MIVSRVGEVSLERALVDGDVACAIGTRGRRGFGLAILGTCWARTPFSRRGGGSGLLALGSGDRDRCGEKPAGGKTGWILDERPGGELGLKPFVGGGVADRARGDEGLDVAGDEGRGDCCSAGGLAG